MSDQEWSELWGMSERDILVVWGLSKEELGVVPFCRHLAGCSKRGCECSDCRMYAALIDRWSVGDGAEEMNRARALKVEEIKRVLRGRIAAEEARVAFYELQRERIAVIKERMAVYAAKLRSQDKP